MSLIPDSEVRSLVQQLLESGSPPRPDVHPGPDVHLCPRAADARERAFERRLVNELLLIEKLVAANDSRLHLFRVARAAGRMLGIELDILVHTCVRRAGGAPEFPAQPVPVRAQIGLEDYPRTEPGVGLLMSVPVYVPAVGVIHAGGSRFLGMPCLFRGDFDPSRMDLLFIVEQLWAGLTAEPSVLNAVTDSPNAHAADWYAHNRESLSLPFEPPLVRPWSRDNAGPGPETASGVTGDFDLEEVR